MVNGFWIPTTDSYFLFIAGNGLEKSIKQHIAGILLLLFFRQ